MRNVNITARPSPHRGIYCTRLRGMCSLCTLCNEFTKRKSSVSGCVSVIIQIFADFLFQTFHSVSWFRAHTQRPHSKKLSHSLLQVRTGGAPTPTHPNIKKKKKSIKQWKCLVLQRNNRAEHDILGLVTLCIKYNLLADINNVANIPLIIYKALFLHQCRLLSNV